MWIYEQTKSEENFSLLPQTVGLPVQTAESALPPVPAQAAEPAEQLTQKEPCIPAKRHATQDCWLLAAAFLVGCTAAGVLQAVCDARQTAAVLSGSVAKAVCAGQYARSGTAFRHGIPGTRPCGQPVSVTGTFCPWPSNDLWQYDVVRLGQRAAYGTALRRRRVESNTSGTAMDRLTGGSSKRLSVLFRSLRFAGQQPNPRIFFPQASRRTSPPRGTGTVGTISADHGGAAAAVRCGSRAFVFGQPPVNGILFLRVLAQCVTITKDHNK
mgnify:CR=1 FL=1